jgi:hypothetical protein
METGRILKPDAPSMDDIRAFLELMVPLLGLRDWRLTNRAYPMEEASSMAEVETNHPAHVSHINWSAFMFTDDKNVQGTQPWQVTIIHEQLHIRLSVYRDHLRQAAMAALPDNPLLGELVCNIARDMEEAAVEQASMALWTLYKRLTGALA